jgi:hypothetical protein
MCLVLSAVCLVVGMGFAVASSAFALFPCGSHAFDDYAPVALLVAGMACFVMGLLLFFLSPRPGVTCVDRFDKDA